MIEFSIFDTLLEPVFVLNENKIILYCNEAAATIAGSTSRKLVRANKPLTEVFDFQTQLDFLDLATINEPSPYKEVRFKNQTGLAGIVQITIQKIKNDDLQNPSQWLMFARDVTLEEQLQNKYRDQLEQKEVVIDQLKLAQTELQKYSKNLESLVAERTSQISEMNQTMMALLNSLNQGFLIFNEQGDCLSVYSKTCETIFETVPAHKKIWEVLKIAPGKVEGIKRWMTTIFSEMLPFEDLAPLGPDYFSHPQNNVIKLEYFPLRNNDKKITGIVLMATDITELVSAQNQAEQEKAKVQQILQIVQNKNHLNRFYNEIDSWLSLLEEQSQTNKVDLELIKRALHTIKGNASLYSIKGLVESSHRAEEELNASPSLNTAAFLKKTLMQLKAEFAVFSEQVTQLFGVQLNSNTKSIEVLESDLALIADAVKYWTRGQWLADLIEDKYFAQKIHSLFQPFHQIIQQTAQQLNKEVSPLAVTGDNITLHNIDLSNLFSTLVHCFRNSVDHGLETPDEREKNGKPKSGLIQVHTRLLEIDQNNFISMQIQDDGAGISPKKIREKLGRNGINTQNESDEQVIQHIFNPSFSTKSEITEISGRGVGLDAVKEAVEKLGGNVLVKSTVGKGTSFDFLIPYSRNANTQIAKKEQITKVS